MQFSYVRSVIAYFVLALLPATVSAESAQVSVRGELNAALEHFSAPATGNLSTRPKTFRAVEPIRLDVQMPEGGEAGEAGLNILSAVRRYWPAYYTSEVGMSADQSEVTLLRGTADIGSDQVPVAGAIYLHAGTPTLFIDFTSAARDTYYHLEVPLISGASSTTATFETTPGEAFAGLACDTGPEHDASAHLPATIGSSRTGTSALRPLEIATEADFEYFSRYGTESNARIAAIVNAADTIYQRDLNVDLQLKFQRTVSASSQPYTSTTSATLLNQFVDYTNANSQLGQADVYHLFSGKDFDGNVLGTAYIAVVCATPSHSYAVNQDIGANTYLIFTHELGHNVGGTHDQGATPSIMSPALNSAVTTFSTFSIDQISAYIAQHGSCLNDGDGGGTPPPPDPRSGTVTLSASFDQTTNRFSASVSAQNAEAADCKTYLAMSADITMAGATTVAWGRAGSKNISGNSKNKKRISTESSLLFVQAFYSCPSLGQNLASDTQSISVGNASSPRRVSTAAKWIKSTLKAAAKNAKKRRNNS